MYEHVNVTGDCFYCTIHYVVCTDLMTIYIYIYTCICNRFLTALFFVFKIGLNVSKISYRLCMYSQASLYRHSI